MVCRRPGQSFISRAWRTCSPFWTGSQCGSWPLIRRRTPDDGQPRGEARGGQAMIVVTGATGELGRAVVENLLLYVPAARVAVSVRKPEDAQAFAARGVAVRRGDFDEPESLVRSVVGADRLLIVSGRGIDHESRALRHRNAINAAVRAGVGHVYYTSLLPGQDSVTYVMKAHLDTEAYLMASGLRFPILKNGVYADAWQMYLGDVTDRK